MLLVILIPVSSLLMITIIIIVAIYLHLDDIGVVATGQHLGEGLGDCVQ
jgi:hypothetical protein